MFLLALIGVPILELLVLVEVARAIGWQAALVVLIVSSLCGWRVLRVQGRVAIDGVMLAVAERRPPGRAAVDGALGFLGGVLLVVPGFLTAVVGLALVFPPTRSLARGWLSRRYGGRAMSFLATAGRFTAGRRDMPHADVDSTAFEDDTGRLDR